MPRYHHATQSTWPPVGGRLTLLAAGLAVAALAVGVVVELDSRHPAPQASAQDVTGKVQVQDVVPPSTAAAKVARKEPVLGVFRGGGSPTDVTAFGTWLGRKPRYALTFGDSTSWATITAASNLREWDASPYRLVYSVPMLPATGPDTIRRGADGAYDPYFAELGRNLVAHGQQDAILRVGWEFNIKNSRWATTDTTAFKVYWRHIVKAFRSVPGQRFTFDWNPVNAHTTYDGSLYYPGATYVDYIGIDVYDVSWIDDTYPWPGSCYTACIQSRREAVWDYLENDEHGLAFWSHFAAQKGKPLSLPEWGMWTRPDGRGGGDNPMFIRNMYTFMTDTRNNVAYQLYFDYDAPDGEHGLERTFPKGGAAFRKLFGGSDSKD